MSVNSETELQDFLFEQGSFLGEILYNLKSGFVGSLVELIKQLLQTSQPKERRTRFAEEVLLQPNFLKTLKSANKVIFKHGEALLHLFGTENLVGLQALKVFFDCCFSEKTNNVRESLAWLLRTHLQSNPHTLKNPEERQFFDQCLAKFANDKSPRVRGEMKTLAEFLNQKTDARKYNSVSEKEGSGNEVLRMLEDENLSVAQ